METSTEERGGAITNISKMARWTVADCWLNYGCTIKRERCCDSGKKKLCLNWEFIISREASQQRVESRSFEHTQPCDMEKNDTINWCHRSVASFFSVILSAHSYGTCKLMNFFPTLGMIQISSYVRDVGISMQTHIWCEFNRTCLLTYALNDKHIFYCLTALLWGRVIEY